MAVKEKFSIIDSIEFVNLEDNDFNPLIKSCEVKVMYMGRNRNNTVISKETVYEMAKTLRGCPIVGVYTEDKGDFHDHGEVFSYDSEGNLIIGCSTVPYGFVDLNSKIWFQTFLEEEKLGNGKTHFVEREYLMTEAYVWEGQYKEQLSSLIKEGRPQSMEITNLEGDWTTTDNSSVELFIINEATFSKLCILGEDVSPCFEGASIYPINHSAYSKQGEKKEQNEELYNSLFCMMKELKELYTLKEKEKVNMSLENNQTNLTEEEFTDNSVNVENSIEDKENHSIENSEFQNNEDKEKDKEEDKKDKEKEEEEKKDSKSKHTIAEFEISLDSNEAVKIQPEEYNALINRVTELTQMVTELTAFKHNTEDVSKQEYIDNYRLLSKEEKAVLRKNRGNYSLDEIKGQLAILYSDKTIADLEKNNGDGEGVNLYTSTLSPDTTLTYSVNNSISSQSNLARILEEKKNNI